MGEFLAFACVTEDRGRGVIAPNDFSSGDPNALIALGVLPTIVTYFNGKYFVDLKIKKFFVLQNAIFDIDMISYTAIGNSINLAFAPNAQSSETTITDKPITICGQPVTNSVGFVIRVTGEYANGVGLPVGSQYAISLGFNSAGKLLSQVILTRSKSSTV